MFWSWLQTSRNTDLGRKHSPRPRLESLEDRTLPTATPIAFAIDPTQSSITLSGEVNYLEDTPLTAQDPPANTSMVTTYHGTLVANYDPTDPGGANGSLQFALTGGGQMTNVIANIGGDWMPGDMGMAGHGPADYGAFNTQLAFQVQAAVRNFTANMSTSSPLPLDAANSFTSTQTLTTTGGVGDVNFAGTAIQFHLEGQSTTNAATANGTLVQGPVSSDANLPGYGDYKLNVPIHFDLRVNIDDQGHFARLTADGTLVAYAHVPVVTLNDGSNPGVNDYATTWSPGGVNATDPNATITTNSAITTQLTQLVVTITNPQDPGSEVLAAATVPPNLTANFDSTSNTLTVTGTGSLSDYQSLLTSITFDDTAAPPTPGTRAVTFVATDDMGNQSLVSTSSVTI
jgi:hypothetical protein